MGNQAAGPTHSANKETQLKTSNSTPALNVLKNTNQDYYTLTKHSKESNDKKNGLTNLSSVHYHHIGGSVNSRTPWPNNNSPILSLQQNKLDAFNKYKNHRKLKATSYLLHGSLSFFEIP
jgi:hypothetical protein